MNKYIPQTKSNLFSSFFYLNKITLYKSAVFWIILSFSLIPELALLISDIANKGAIETEPNLEALISTLVTMFIFSFITPILYINRIRNNSVMERLSTSSNRNIDVVWAMSIIFVIQNLIVLLSAYLISITLFSVVLGTLPNLEALWTFALLIPLSVIVTLTSLLFASLRFNNILKVAIVLIGIQIYAFIGFSSGYYINAVDSFNRMFGDAAIAPFVVINIILLWMPFSPMLAVVSLMNFKIDPFILPIWAYVVAILHVTIMIPLTFSSIKLI